MNTQMIGKNSMKHYYLKTKVKLDLLTDIDMLLMVEKVTEVECVMLFIDL